MLSDQVTEYDLYSLLARYLEQRGLKTSQGHDGNAMPILQTEDELGLQINLEINNQVDGSHETLPLHKALAQLHSTEARDHQRNRRARMSDLTDEQKAVIAKINKMSQAEMAYAWRFAPAGHPYFDRTQPYIAVFEKRFRELGGMTPLISKQIGH